MEQSKSFQINKEDLKKILKGLAIAMAGAGVTYLVAIVDLIDVGAYTPLWVAVSSALINALRIWIQGQSQ